MTERRVTLGMMRLCFFGNTREKSNCFPITGTKSPARERERERERRVVMIIRCVHYDARSLYYDKEYPDAVSVCYSNA